MDLGTAHECTRCALSQTRTTVVVGSGSLNAPLIVIGEAPGKSEDEGGVPFIGRSGQLLFTLIAEELALSREHCYVTNVVKCRPPGNRQPLAPEIAACSPWLEAQQAMWSGKVALTLGLTAARVMTGSKSPMRELHGIPVVRDNLTIVPTYHPAAALRQGPSVVAVMRADLAVLRGLLS
jgi:uracil-DNA glycosylase